MGCEFFGVVRLDRWTPPSRSIRAAKLKSAITRLLLVLEVWDGKPTYRKSWAANVFVWLDLTLDPFFKVERGYCFAVFL